MFYRKDDDSPPELLLAGGDFANSLLVLEPGKPQPRILRNDAKVAVIDVASCIREPRLHCLTMQNGKVEVATINLTEETGNKQHEVVAIGNAPILNGFAMADLIGNGSENIVVACADKIGIAFGSGEDLFANINFWPLPVPAKLMGSLLPLPTSKGQGDAVLFLSENGELWSVSMEE